MAVVAALAMAGSCTLKDQSAPSLVGPSEFSLSLNLTASPDSIIRDGASQTQVVAYARGAQSQPYANLSVRLGIQCADASGVRQTADFGSLSAKTVATGSDGRATITYTAPPDPSPLDTYCANNTVWVIATPILDNYANQTSREVQIRLVPAGVIVPPSNLAPTFTYTSAFPTEGETVVFNATDSAGAIASYAWDFGDGSTGSGIIATHAYSKAGAYNVTLTVADAVGRAVSMTQNITVNPGIIPNADFTYSPRAPAVSSAVYFNASASTAAAGRTITGYSWDFGDGGTGSGVTTSHTYTTGGAYVVVLTVTDDVGRQDSSTQNVTVTAASAAAASFTISPTTPVVGRETRFDASASRASEGATITSWAWDFGDGNTETGQTTRHTYTAAGSFIVRLTITDSASKTASTTTTLAVTAGLTANFTLSPTSGGIGTTINVNASSSSPAPGRTIQTYSWDYGCSAVAAPPQCNTATATGQTSSTVYLALGTYTITLTVTDDLGATATKTATITIS